MFNFWLGFKSMIRTDSNGQKLFFPNGNMGAGYIIPSEEVYKRIKRSYIAFFLFAMIMVIFIGFLIIVFDINLYLGLPILLIAIIGAFYIWVATQTRDLVKLK